jgi:protein OS-9
VTKSSSDQILSSPIISSYESLIKDNQRYLCAVPYVEPRDSSTPHTNRTIEDEEKELALATQRGWELLKGMDGSCIYFMSGWWSYSFCYNKGVRQFHPLPSGRNVPIYPPVEDKSVAAYVLGRFAGSEHQPKDEEEVDDEDALKKHKETKSKEDAKTQSKNISKLEVKGQTRYLVKQLGGGTVCDLTGEERTIEVQVSNSNHL